MHAPNWNNEVCDECLIDALVSGDIAAMEVLYERYSKPFFSLAYRTTGCKQSSEDLVQAAFLAIWRNRTAYSQEVGNVHRWLFSIMHYRIIDYLRHQRSRRKEIPWQDVKYEETPLLPDPCEQIWRVEQATILHKAMHALSTEQRTVVELAYFKGLTHEKIAECCHIPLGTAKSRLRLSLLHLKRLLIEYGMVGV